MGCFLSFCFLLVHLGGRVACVSDGRGKRKTRGGGKKRRRQRESRGNTRERARPVGQEGHVRGKARAPSVVCAATQSLEGKAVGHWRRACARRPKKQPAGFGGAAAFVLSSSARARLSVSLSALPHLHTALARRETTHLRLQLVGQDAQPVRGVRRRHAEVRKGGFCFVFSRVRWHLKTVGKSARGEVGCSFSFCRVSDGDARDGVLMRSVVKRLLLQEEGEARRLLCIAALAKRACCLLGPMRPPARGPPFLGLPSFNPRCTRQSSRCDLLPRGAAQRAAALVRFY